MERYDPIHNAERFADRPLLMTTGEVDPLVPPECNQRLEKALRPHYENDDRLRLSIYPGIAHEVPPAMWDESKAWLKRWLPVQPS